MSYSVETGRKRRISVIIAGSVLAAMIVTVGLAATLGSTGSGGKKNRTAHGAVSIANAKFFVPDSTAVPNGCHGIGNFTDIATGGTVTISDSAGRILATTHLQPGKVDSNGFCIFDFDAPKIATGRGPYGIQITRREIAQGFNESDLFSFITLTLGNG